MILRRVMAHFQKQEWAAIAIDFVIVDEDAEAVFQQLQDSRVKTVLSVNAQGRVREYRLQMTYRFRLVDAKGRELVGPNEIALPRDIT